ncbi:MAG: DUF5693 family protein [Desulfitobacteriaceae bacterium]|nr:DUF5693 family protein [Desulfitobacteriaceae bacterium]MDD4753025.1 DUF5693 family protein [Desulfitobacteriaceae bacterium]
MSNKWLKYILTIIIAAGVLLSFYLVWERHRVEQANKQVEISVDWNQVKMMARQEGAEAADVLAKLKGTVNGIVFKEETINELAASGEVVLKKGTELLWDLEIGRDSVKLPVENGMAQEVHANWTYLIFHDEHIMARVSENLAVKHQGKENIISYHFQTSGGTLPVLATSLKEEEIINVGVGFDDIGMLLAAEEGFHILPQIRSWRNVDEKSLDLTFAQFEQLPVSAVLFNDMELPGIGLPAEKQEAALEGLAERVTRLDVPAVMVEFFPQKGMETVARHLEKDIVRLHAISENEMPAMSQSRAVDRFTLAVTDRNMRVLLVRFFPNMNLSDNALYLTEIHDFLEREGFSFGAPKTLGSLPFSRLFTLVLGSAVAAGGVLLFTLLGYSRLGIALGLLGFLGCAGLIFIGQVNLARKLLALVSVLVFPTMAVTLHLKDRPAGVLRALWLFVRTTAFSLIGALLMVGLLADKTFMYTLDRFTGVKIAHVLPLLFIIIIFWFIRDKENNPVKKIIRVLDHPVTVKYVVLLGIMGVVLLIYVMRTGNENAAVPAWELMIRSKLEYLLSVRPRTKEFLIGHPLMILMFYLGYRDKYLPLLLVGVIGQVSLVNTFAHIHTPLLISLIRTFNGMWLGALLGVILIGMFLVWRRIEKYLKAAAEES